MPTSSTPNIQESAEGHTSPKPTLWASPTESVTVTTNIEAEKTNREASNAALIVALKKKALSEVESTWELDVINDTERGRWIAALGAEAIGELTYRFVGSRVVLLSAWVSLAYLI